MEINRGDLGLIHVTNKNFDRVVGKSKLPVVVDAYATWCPPCKMMEPIIESGYRQLKGRVKFVKLDVVAESELAQRLKITVLPTFLFYNQGKELKRESGYMSEAQLLQKISCAFPQQSKGCR